MAKNTVVHYDEKEVVLSRLYPFGEKRKEGEKEVSVLVAKELNGFDDEIIDREINNGKLAGYVQIAVSCGIEYKEAQLLANKDSQKLIETLQGF